MSQTGKFQKKPLIIFELNEFNEDLLETAAKQHNLKNILALLSYPKTKIKDNSPLENQTPEMAERWETIHTGIAPNLHGVSQLGTQYAPYRPLPYWETLLAEGHTIGIWGAINAKKPRNPLSKFFVPDLWQAKTSAYPKALTSFIALPRYISKSFASFTPDELLRNSFKFISFIKNSGMGKKITLELIRLFTQLVHTTPRTLLFVCFYDLISCMLFTAQLKKNPVHLSVFFANSLAYLQHYYWKQGKWVATTPLLHGLKIIDKMAGMLRKFEKSHHIILMNGLSQKNRQHQPEKMVYKIKDPSQFFRYMALSPSRVDPLSPNHGIVYFNHSNDCDIAIHQLNQATQAGSPIFKASKIDHYPQALHYEMILNTTATKEDFFELNGTEFRFFKYFKPVYTLTGSHDNHGILYSLGVGFPKEIMPESFSKYIVTYYAPEGVNNTPHVERVEYA
jgi:hypothetical protein